MVMRTWQTVEMNCEAGEIENLKAELKERGYCWELYHNKAEKNEYRAYTFKVFCIINLTTGKVEPA